MSLESNNRTRSGGSGGLDVGETTDVRELHAAILRERPDPVEGREPLNLWVVAFIAALLFWAGSYLTQYSGGFRADEFSENQINPAPAPVVVGGGDDPVSKAVKEGAIVFGASCSPCHQVDGNGVAGQFPPLAGSEWVLAEGPNRIIRIVLNGLGGPIQVKGSDYNNAMNGFRDGLDDRQIANVLTYVRNSWGNKASLVTPAEVAAIRGATSDRSQGWTVPELEKVPVSGGAAPVTPALTAESLKEALKKLSPEDLKIVLQDVGK